MKMFEKFKVMFSKPPKNTYILVREGNFGIETYVNEYIVRFNRAYKDQLISFLKSIIQELEEVKK
jgi:hypothetical protein